jgi:hypothetical protein
MTSKGIFFWSKRQSSAEPYYRTGGLLPIDTSPNDSSNGFETEVRVDDEQPGALAERIDVVAQDDEHKSVVKGMRRELCRKAHAPALWSIAIR